MNDRFELDAVVRPPSVEAARAARTAIKADPGLSGYLAAELWDRGDLHSVGFGTLLPGLGGVAGGDPTERLSVRAANLLMRGGFVSWKLLALTTPGQLRRTPNCGVLTFSEICSTLFEAWTEVEPHEEFYEDVAAMTTREPAQEWSQLASIEADVISFLRLAWARLGARTFGEALSLWTTSDQHFELGDVAQRLGDQEIASLLGLPALSENVWREVFDFGDRDFVILSRRVMPAGQASTLAELGDELRVTRERVRQLESHIRKTLATRLEAGSGLAIRHRAARIVRELGKVTELGADIQLCEEIARSTSECPEDEIRLRCELLRELCGPYGAVGDLAFSPDALRHLNNLELVLNAVDPGEILGSERLDELFDAWDIRPELLPAVWQHLAIKEFQGRFVRWGGSMADRAAGTLAAIERPMTMFELHEAVGLDCNPRSLAGQVQSDARISRIGKDLYGLRIWGRPEYAGIMEQLERAIEDAGGVAELDALVARFVTDYGVTESSVRAYAGDRRFTRRNGSIRFRTGNDPEPVFRQRPVAMSGGAVQRGGVWYLRVEVDEEALRGSGRPIRAAIAAAAGLEPELTLGCDYAGTVVTFSWSGRQPTIGSVREVLLRYACAEGDLLFLPLGCPEPSIPHVVRLTERSRAGGPRRLALELGVDPDVVDPDAPNHVAEALGLPAGADWSDVAERLRERGEESLVEYLPDGWQ